MTHPQSEWWEHLTRDRARVADAAQLTQADVDNLAATWAARLSQETAAELFSGHAERFDLCDEDDRATGITAPRWLCHLLGLRHRAVHVLLWVPNGLAVLQVRSPHKAYWPGLIDISVGGHVRAGQSYLEAAWDEMEEELGVAPPLLAPPGLTPVGEPQPDDEPDSRQSPWLCNRQFNQLYAARLTAEGLASVRFRDGEVCALYLCPSHEIDRLIVTGGVAPGLAHAWRVWRAWEALPSGARGDSGDSNSQTA